MTIDTTRFLDHGPVEIRSSNGDGTYHRSVINPGDDLSGIQQEVREAIEAHWTLERVADYEAATAPDPVAPPTRWIVQKVTLIERMTDREIETLRTFLAANGRWIERWRATVQVWSDDAHVRQLLEGRFGVGRADELLALE